MRALTILLPLMVSAYPAAAQQPADSGSPARVAVELWTGGDDGLTQRLAEAVREEFRASPRFRLADTANGLRTLKVFIPTHVGWREVGGRTHVTYQLEIERGGRRRSVPGGSCWETDLEQCARQIIRTVATHSTAE